MRYIRHFMGARTRDSEGVLRIKPRRFQVYGWQAGVMFLTLSVAAMILGMCVLIWSSTAFGPAKIKGTGWWDNNSKLAVAWTTVTVATVFASFMAQVSLAMRKDKA